MLETKRLIKNIKPKNRINRTFLTLYICLNRVKKTTKNPSNITYIELRGKFNNCVNDLEQIINARQKLGIYLNILYYSIIEDTSSTPFLSDNF